VAALDDDAEKKFQQALATCKNAKEELLQLQLARMVGARKQPRSTSGKASPRTQRAAS
jgi:hypothetical protein